MAIINRNPRMRELVQRWVRERSDFPTLQVERLEITPKSVNIVGRIPQPDGTLKPHSFRASSSAIENYLLARQRRGEL